MGKTGGKKKSYALTGSIVVGLQQGTERTVYATWPATGYKRQDGYVVTWYYDTGQGIWFVGNDSSTANLIATYTAPSNATRVLVRIGPKPNNKAKWCTDQSAYAIYDKGWATKPDDPTPPEDPTPAAPGSVDIEVKGKKVTVKVPNYNDAKCDGNLRIQIVEDDSKVVSDAKVALSLNSASYEWSYAVIGGHRYKARAMAIGSKGTNSAWSSYSSNQYTPPGKATISAVVSVSKNSVDVRWQALTGAESYTIEYTSETVDGKPVWDSGSSAVQSASGITATHFYVSSLDYKRWYFRLKGVGISGAGDGEWSDDASLVLGTTPDKPTTWSYTTVGRVGTPIVFNWVHSSEDGSEQSGAIIGITVNNGAESTVTLTTQSSYSYQTNNLPDGAVIKWRVRTRGTIGIATEWGAYSEYRQVVVYSPPSIQFSVGYPGEGEYPVVRQFPIEITGLSAPLSQTPVSYFVSIRANTQYDISGADGIEIHVTANQEVYSKYIPTSSHNLALTLNPGDIYLNEGTAYTVTVTVAMSNGLTAEESHIFMAQWDAGEWDPSGEVTIDKNLLTAYIRPFCADNWGFEYREGFMLGVYRIDFDGNLTEISTGIDPAGNITVSDLHPSLDFARYRITATDLKTGVVSYADLPAIPVGVGGAVIQWEGEAESFYADPYDLDSIVNTWSGTMIRLPYNVDVSDDISPDVSLVEYIGRKHPVSYYGTQQGSTSRWTAEFSKQDVETLGKIRALSIYPGDVFVREASGTGYWANVKVSTSIPHDKPTVLVTFAITRVEGGA